MALNPYDPCPCGSGKKFKWCCQPIHVPIDEAFRLDAEGQHDAALRMMDDVTTQNPANPEGWGRKAQLLFENNQVEEAEAALQRALDINPNYPFGHFLRGLFRHSEGEIAGSLLLFRKAAELYDPAAHDFLGRVYSLIGECELKLNRPVAARAALKLALHYEPADEHLRQSFEAIFGDKSILPLAARQEYAFLSPGTSTAPTRRQNWDQALGDSSKKLPDAALAFEKLTRDDDSDSAAWYNLGLCRAWLGENGPALEALDRYVALETDDSRAAAAWTLGDVLRCGQGMEDRSDYVEHSILYQVREPRRIGTFLQESEAQRRLIGIRVNEEQGFLTALLLQRAPDLTPALVGSQAPGLAAYLLLVADRLRLWHTSAQRLREARAELEQELGPTLAVDHEAQGPVNFTDILAEALAFPVHVSDQAEARRKVQEAMQRFFEEQWIHRPLHALNLIPPIDAAGHAVLRKKLMGVVNFLDQCSGPTQEYAYDFDRLRRKLGLMPGETPQAAKADGAAADVSAMSAAELAALPVDTLPEESLEQAYQAAVKLDAKDLAGRFARQLIARPPAPGRGDRFPWYSHLLQVALVEGNTDEALNYVNEGERDDCEHNEGRRRNDYELRRGQVQARRGEVTEAEGTFERLIDRAPAELRYRGSAAEAMLALKQGPRALRFAEQGLAKAKEKNDRDSVEYFKELVAAAKKQTGT
jgi:tetratricopeptide (TPR) repeat protein